MQLNWIYIYIYIGSLNADILTSFNLWVTFNQKSLPFQSLLTNLYMGAHCNLRQSAEVALALVDSLSKNVKTHKRDVNSGH